MHRVTQTQTLMLCCDCCGAGWSHIVAAACRAARGRPLGHVRHHAGSRGDAWATPHCPLGATHLRSPDKVRAHNTACCGHSTARHAHNTAWRQHVGDTDSTPVCVGQAAGNSRKPEAGRVWLGPRNISGLWMDYMDCVLTGICQHTRVLSIC